ncbi:MAG: pseudouridine synthase [Clostridia bacterium]|nr:pseudouridine synthase [Clostridia bacterium]
MPTQRLDKLLAMWQNRSRREVREDIRHGKATVDGRPERDPGRAIDPERQEIRLEGQVFRFQPFLYLMMNKPAGVLTATEDRSAPTVLDLVPEAWRRKKLSPVGRLDKDTTGLLLLTDDGGLNHRLCAPKTEIYKTYVAELDGCVTPEMRQLFLEGVTLADGTVCRPAVLTALSETSAQIEICEGKYHQVKRMFAAAGRTVTALERTAVGGFSLPETLRPGECRELPENFLTQIHPALADVLEKT